MSKVYDTIDLNTIKLAPAKPSRAAPGCRTANFQGPGGSKVSIQTPLMSLPWDVAPRKMDEDSKVSASLSLSFVGMDESDPDDDKHKFMKFMKDFDARAKELIVATNGSLGKKSEEKVLDVNFKDSVKESASGDYAPTIQPKIWLSLKDGGSSKCVEDHTMDIHVFNLQGKEIGKDELNKGCPIAAIIEPSYVWSSTLGVGITWVAKQAVLKPIVQETFGFTLGAKFDHLRDDADEPDKKKIKASEEKEDSDGSVDPLEEEF